MELYRLALGGRQMLRKAFFVFAFAAILAVPFMTTGCVTKPLAGLMSFTTQVVTFDDPTSTFLVYGPNSTEFAASMDNFASRTRTYNNQLHHILDGWDKYFLLYDKNDPFEGGIDN
jgi:hypothetical protein